jgi:hypothetical protein
MFEETQVLSGQTSYSSAFLNAMSLKVCTQLWTAFFIFRSRLSRVYCIKHQHIYFAKYNKKEFLAVLQMCSVSAVISAINELQGH